MAREGLFEQVCYLGTILGTEASAANIPVFLNDRYDGATVKIEQMYVTGQVTASATNYYTITWKNDAGSTVGTTAFSSTAPTVTTPIEVTLTAANSYLGDGEFLYATFAQTGNGMTLLGLAVHLQLKVYKKAT
jgi:hypothetical protein